MEQKKAFIDKISERIDPFKKYVDKRYDQAERCVEKQIREERRNGNDYRADRMEEKLQEFREKRNKR